MTKNTQTGRTKTSRLAPEEMTPRATLPFGKALCKECDKILPQADFPKRKGEGGQTRYLKTCRPCFNVHQAKKTAQRRRTMRECPSCNKKQFPRFFEFRDEGDPCTKCVPQTHRRCTKCQRVKEFSGFRLESRGFYQSECLECARHSKEERRTCRGCRRTRARSAYGELRWRLGNQPSSYRNHGSLAYTKFCLDGKPATVNFDRRSLEYDYSFGRTVLDYTHDQTVYWLAVGYGAGDLQQVSKILKSAPVHWEPDPVEDCVSA